MRERQTSKIGPRDVHRTASQRIVKSRGWCRVQPRAESNRTESLRTVPCHAAPHRAAPAWDIDPPVYDATLPIHCYEAGRLLPRSADSVRPLARLYTYLLVCLFLRYLVHSYIIRSSIRPSLREKQRCLGFLSLPCLTHALTAFPFAKTPLIFDHYPIFFSSLLVKRSTLSSHAYPIDDVISLCFNLVYCILYNIIF